MNNVCPICKRSATTNLRITTGDDYHEVNCPVCGKYEVTRTASLLSLATDEPNNVLSALIRNRYELNEKVSLTSTNMYNLLESASVPSNPFEIIDHLLEFIFRKRGKTARFVNFDPGTDYPILFAENPDEFIYYLEKARELSYIEPGPGSFGFRLSLEGWRRIAELRGTVRRSNQAFVAMWFDSELNKAWTFGFKPALESTRLKPIRIDLTEHNEKICDRIIAEIRRSGLLVADFTGQRGGVYFEAGFAMGLGIPVIWTCSESDVSNLHFDTRQYNPRRF